MTPRKFLLPLVLLGALPLALFLRAAAGGGDFNEPGREEDEGAEGA